MTTAVLPLLKTSSGVGVALPSARVLEFTQILGIGRNYAQHAREQGAAIPDRPMVFSKNAASACLSGDEIVIPACCRDGATGGEQVDFEGELAVVIGSAVRDVSKQRAMEHVLGYCVANDVSARWWQKTGGGGQFWRGKSFDTFCPLGPWLTPAAAVADPHALRLVTTLNGEVMQDGTTGDMIFDIPTLISELSRGLTLLPGTVILTGTPSGVGMARTPPVWLKDGDAISVEIEGLGTLSNRVRAGG
jgi:2-keto-4-pentenoate hydratase/2-oxohepta-3-ene-1,7-dioic acid hydratase in catechol pathway